MGSEAIRGLANEADRLAGRGEDLTNGTYQDDDPIAVLPSEYRCRHKNLTREESGRTLPSKILYRTRAISINAFKRGLQIKKSAEDLCDRLSRCNRQRPLERIVNDRLGIDAERPEHGCRDIVGADGIGGRVGADFVA